MRWHGMPAEKACGIYSCADTYSKPLLIFGSLTQTISLTQQENALLQMDRAFIEQWNLWMAALDAEEKPEGNNDAG